MGVKTNKSCQKLYCITYLNREKFIESLEALDKLGHLGFSYEVKKKNDK